MDKIKALAPVAAVALVCGFGGALAAVALFPNQVRGEQGEPGQVGQRGARGPQGPPGAPGEGLDAAVSTYTVAGLGGCPLGQATLDQVVTGVQLVPVDPPILNVTYRDLCELGGP